MSADHASCEFDLPIPEALHRPAAEGVRMVALWWLAQARALIDRSALHELPAFIGGLRSTLRENRELLNGTDIKDALRRLEVMQHAVDAVSELDAERTWLEAESEMVAPEAREIARALAAKLERKSRRREKIACDALQKHFERVERALQSTLLRFSIHGTIGIPLNLDPFSAHAAGRLDRHLAKVTRALDDIREFDGEDGIDAVGRKRDLKRVADSLDRTLALLAPFVAHVPALGLLYHSATSGRQRLAAMSTAARLARRARAAKLDGLATMLNDLRLSHASAFADSWIADGGERALSGAYAAMAALQLSVDVTQLSHARLTTEFGVPVEIERKYLLRGCPPEAAVVPGARIEQGWIPGRTLRERLRHTTYPTGVSRYTRTVKFGRGISRVELEEDTDRAVFDALWPLTATARVRKRRHAIRDGEYTWEIDVFTDRDLVLAEVELYDVDASPALPSWLEKWLVREVTGEAEYLNVNLALAEDERPLDPASEGTGRAPTPAARS